MGEEILVERFKRGDEAAFIIIYEKYFQDVYNFVSYSVSFEASEDLTQEIFIKLYKSMEKFKGNCSLKTWIFNIARRTIYDWYRTKRSFLNIDDYSNSLITNKNPEEMFENNEELRQLIEGLNKLKKDYKLVILLRKYHGFSIKETAEIMGYSEGKVKTILHRGLKNLREILEEEGFERGVKGIEKEILKF
ncbi:RNA polymerase sigma factor [Anaerobranca gottschalkii]|uniref:RNA polymerase sigma-70 factor, ECF subfamily n=1 Tax=Anaerobranca gottschalkii DSM 13577 TaxID=1120990 RepID=A0A1I0AZ85_9FIRM|nr:RNA polymerase sigma factor [Anaerobranca gottschalkii]SES99768.1 RNA polymerase sigma-70 factor, ECF subfamily [Anaerobranca gottschalkii DSM 13577]